MEGTPKETSGHGEPVLPDKPRRSDVARVTQALTHGWTTPEELVAREPEILQRLYDIVLDPETKKRMLLSTLRLLDRMKRTNIAAQQVADGVPSVGVNVNVGVTVQDVLADIRRDPELVEFARERATRRAGEEGDNGSPHLP